MQEQIAYKFDTMNRARKLSITNRLILKLECYRFYLEKKDLPLSGNEKYLKECMAEFIDSV